MNRSYQNIRKYAQLLGSICGGLLMSLSAIPLAALAQQTTPKVNPCPRIFYEEPHNSRVMVPQGCPPNALTRTMAAQGLIPITPSPDQTRLGVGGESPVPTRPPASTIQPPAPEQQQAPVATIALVNGRVNIRLVNDTGAKVTYQVIGDTPARSLPGKSDVTLRGLSTPTTVTFNREDGGLLTVTPKPSSQSGILEVTFNETTDVKQDRSAMRIQNNGSVFLN